MEIKIIDYDEKYKQILLDLINKLAKFAKSIDPINRVQNLEGFPEASFEDMLGDISKNEGKIMLASVDDQIVGYIVVVIWKQSKLNKLEIGEHKVGEVLDLFVEENIRGQGIGKKLLKEAEKYLIKSSCDSMWLQVFEPNKVARNVYKKFGFVEREIGMLKKLH